jgi:hypothetical protein
MRKLGFVLPAVPLLIGGAFNILVGVGEIEKELKSTQRLFNDRLTMAHIFRYLENLLDSTDEPTCQAQ